MRRFARGMMSRFVLTMRYIFQLRKRYVYATGGTMVSAGGRAVQAGDYFMSEQASQMGRMSRKNR